jgi:hypothetical protein
LNLATFIFAALICAQDVRLSPTNGRHPASALFRLFRRRAAMSSSSSSALPPAAAAASSSSSSSAAAASSASASAPPPSSRLAKLREVHARAQASWLRGVGGAPGALPAALRAAYPSLAARHGRDLEAIFAEFWQVLSKNYEVRAKLDD